MSSMNLTRIAFLLLGVFTTTLALADDWPHWMGPGHDGVWRETGIVENLPSDPKDLNVKWRVPCDLGYSGPAVSNGRVYVFEYEKSQGEITNNPGGKDKLKGTERLRCLDASSGNEIWRYEYDRPYRVSYPSGPRCTPTVDDDHVYILGTMGDLTCLKTADGSVVWKKSFKKDYDAGAPLWGHSAHPLVDGDTLYCMVGGEGSVAVALDKQTGEEKWRALSAYKVGYCPPSMISHQGEKQLVIFHPEAVNGLNPASGEVLWSVPIKPEFGMSIAQPNLIGDHLFTSGYGGGVSVYFKLPEGDEEPEIIWSGTPKTSVSAANATPIVDSRGEVIYGCHANSSILVAVDVETGERLWSTREPTLSDAKNRRARHGTAFLVRQGDSDNYWLMSENGDLIVANLTVEGYNEISRVNILEASGGTFGRSVVWSHPAYANRCIYARNDKEIVCIDLSAK